LLSCEAGTLEGFSAALVATGARKTGAEEEEGEE
jgi:hypothetical protein